MIQGENKSRWTGERIAMLGFLLGCGWDAKRIAAHPLIVSTPNNIHRQTQRFGLSFKSRAIMENNFTLPPGASKNLDIEAEKRGVTREAMMKMILITAATHPHLIRNIMDDGVE